MSTYSEAWKAMDSDLRNFYVSWSHINSYQLWHWEYWPEYEFWNTVNYYAQGLPGYLGYHIAQRNWGIQTVLNGSFDKNKILLGLRNYPNDGVFEPLYDCWNWFNYQSGATDLLDFTSINQYVDPPTDPPTEEEPFFYGYEMPRLKYKVRKSYWTGYPKRRRNL